MRLITILLIAVGLSMDTFAISVAGGATIKDLKVNNALKIALFFGLFQLAMPVFGWLTGLGLRNFISGVDHWVAFGLLTLIGCKMIYESRRLGGAEKRIQLLNPSVLFLLAVATSIDAFAVGLSLSFLSVSIAGPVVIIGAVTFLLSFSGVFAGNRFGHLFENKLEVAGGLILIGIGLKIVLEHLLYA